MSVDLSKLSDEDLDALEKKDLTRLSDQGLEYLEKSTKPDSPLVSFAKSIGRGIGWAGEKYERYLTGPTRAAVMEEAKHGLEGRPSRAFWGQFGEDPSKAPAGKEIAAEIGFSTERPGPPSVAPLYIDPKLTGGVDTRFNPGVTKSPAEIAGTVIDFGADPLVFAPAGAIVKGAGKAAKSVVRGGMDLAAKGVDLAAGTTDVLTGTNLATRAMKGAGQIKTSAGTIVDAANEALRKVFTPKKADDFRELATIASKNGIDPAYLPESVEFGKGSFLDSAARSRREGPLGAEYLARFEEGYRKVQTALDDKVSKISGGAPLSQPAAGVELRKSFDNAQRTFWDSIEVTHDKIVTQYAPGLYMDREALEKINSVANGIEKFAKGRVERGITAEARSQGQELLNAVQAFRAGNGSYKQSVEALREIGEAAFSTQSYPGKIPSDIEKLRKLYFSIDDGLISTVEKHVNPDFAAELRANNLAIHDVFEKKNQLGHILSDKNIAPEEAFKRIVLNGDTDQLAALSKTLPPEDIQKLKGAFIESLIKREADGTFNMGSLFKAMRGKENQIKMLFSPQEITEIGELLQLGDRFGRAVMSSSGTGASNVFHQLKDSLVSGVYNDTMIEGLKNKARNPSLPGAQGVSRRSPVWYGAKGAQTLEGGNAMQRRIQSTDDSDKKY